MWSGLNPETLVRKIIKKDIIFGFLRCGIGEFNDDKTEVVCQISRGLNSIWRTK
jgi:hypothetical protein